VLQTSTELTGRSFKIYCTFSVSVLGLYSLVTLSCELLTSNLLRQLFVTRATEALFSIPFEYVAFLVL